MARTTGNASIPQLHAATHMQARTVRSPNQKQASKTSSSSMLLASQLCFHLHTFVLHPALVHAPAHPARLDRLRHRFTRLTRIATLDSHLCAYVDIWTRHERVLVVSEQWSRTLAAVEERTACAGNLTHLRTLAYGLLSALSSLHRAGLVHACLSPSCVQRDGRASWRVGGWMLHTLTHAGTDRAHRDGQPFYYPPELILAGPNADAAAYVKADVWAAGVLLMQAARGYDPACATRPIACIQQALHMLGVDTAEPARTGFALCCLHCNALLVAPASTPRTTRPATPASSIASVPSKNICLRCYLDVEDARHELRRRRKSSTESNGSSADGADEVGWTQLFELLKSCLTRDVAARPAADELLGHPFFQSIHDEQRARQAEWIRKQKADADSIRIVPSASDSTSDADPTLASIPIPPVCMWRRSSSLASAHLTLSQIEINADVYADASTPIIPTPLTPPVSALHELPPTWVLPTRSYSSPASFNGLPSSSSSSSSSPLCPHCRSRMCRCLAGFSLPELYALWSLGTGSDLGMWAAAHGLWHDAAPASSSAPRLILAAGSDEAREGQNEDNTLLPHIPPMQRLLSSPPPFSISPAPTDPTRAEYRVLPPAPIPHASSAYVPLDWVIDCIGRERRAWEDEVEAGYVRQLLEASQTEQPRDEAVHNGNKKDTTSGSKMNGSKPHRKEVSGRSAETDKTASERTSRSSSLTTSSIPTPSDSSALPSAASSSSPPDSLSSVISVSIRYLLHCHSAHTHYPATRRTLLRYAATLSTLPSPVAAVWRARIWPIGLGVAGDVSALYEICCHDESSYCEDEQLDKDTTRCHQYDAFLRSTQGQAKLKRVLKCWLLANPGKVYWQGLHSVAAPFVKVFFEDEAMAFSCLQQLVSTYLSDIYVPDNHVTLNAKLQTFCQLLSFHEPQLYTHLHQSGCNPEIYVIPWFFTLFARQHTRYQTSRAANRNGVSCSDTAMCLLDFILSWFACVCTRVSDVLSLSQIYLLWDALLLEDPSVPFPLFLSLALLQLQRSSLLTRDFHGCVLALTHLPAVDVIRWVACARRLMAATPACMYESERRTNKQAEMDGMMEEKESYPIVSTPPQPPTASGNYRTPGGKFRSPVRGSLHAPRVLISPRITRSELEELMQQQANAQGIIIVDIRAKSDYDSFHLSHSLSLPLPVPFYSLHSSRRDSSRPAPTASTHPTLGVLQLLKRRASTRTNSNAAATIAVPAKPSLIVIVSYDESNAQEFANDLLLSRIPHVALLASGLSSASRSSAVRSGTHAPPRIARSNDTIATDAPATPQRTW